MPPRSGRVEMAWVLAALGFGVLGLLGGVLFRERPEAANARSTRVASPGTGVDEGALDELIEEVRLLREAVERLPAVLAGRPQREPVAAEGATEETLDAWFTALDRRLAELAVLAAAPSSGPPLKLPREDFEPILFPPREELSTREFSKRHIFWSYQQVIDAYGIPDQISTNPHGSQIWQYRDGDDDLEFVFRDGFVLRVEW